MIATTHLLTTERSRVQLIGVRGQWVISAYQQMARFIELRLGQNHAGLFAEPVIAANTIDWFTAAEGDVKPFAQLNETEQAALLQETRRLVADLQQLAPLLSASPQSDQLLIGEILQSMLAFPDQNLFRVGEQPVVAGWGLRFNDADLTWQATSLIQSKAPAGLDAGTSEPLSGARKVRQPANAPATPIARRRPGTPATAATDVAVDAMDSSEKAIAPSDPWRKIPGIGLLLALIVALLIGLRGCEGLALQWGHLPFAVSPNPQVLIDPSAVTRQREYQLRQELAQLQAVWLEKQRACANR